MEKEFVTYEIAESLKELDYLSKVFGVFYNGEFTITFIAEPTSDDYPHFVVLAPLWQQVFDWFRKKHQIGIEILSSGIHFYDGITLLPPKYQFLVEKSSIHSDDYLYHSADDSLYYDSYEEVREKAVLKAIELIKNK